MRISVAPGATRGGDHMGDWLDPGVQAAGGLLLLLAAIPAYALGRARRGHATAGPAGELGPADLVALGILVAAVPAAGWAEAALEAGRAASYAIPAVSLAAWWWFAYRAGRAASAGAADGPAPARP